MSMSELWIKIVSDTVRPVRSKEKLNQREIAASNIGSTMTILRKIVGEKMSTKLSCNMG